jgi:UDP-N-acetylmuramoylalanine--D-glutamate ligase
VNIPGRALVIGYGLSGRAAARWLASNGSEVVVLEDDPKVVRGAQEPVKGRGVSVQIGRGPERAEKLACSADLVVPSPGVPVSHPALVAAKAFGVEVLSEIELAWRALDAMGGPGERPRLVAITGTNGKTTVTKLVVAMLAASGKEAVAAGNVGYPLLAAVSSISPGSDGALVAEVSSFQLEHTRKFRPDVSCWLNFAPDHLDWHPSLEHYARAKAKIWSSQGPGCVAVVNADDSTVRRAAVNIPAGVEVVSFGLAPLALDVDRAEITSAGVRTAESDAPGAPEPAWRVSLEGIAGPGGFFLAAGDLPRALPHDLANTAAAIAVAMAAGANAQGCRQAAASTLPPAHRVQLVGQSGGVAWYDDSKATTPAAVLAGVSGFNSVVLIAGGRNKGLDLSDLASTVPPVRAVVAIGEASNEVTAAFFGQVPVRQAQSMSDAVEAALRLAVPGDVVVLSPGCASFDWYSNYKERGDHFTALVKDKFGSELTGAQLAEGDRQ